MGERADLHTCGDLSNSGAGVTWLHLADVHLPPGGDDRYRVDKAVAALVETLRRERKECPPDLIFFTGDLADKGKDYAKAGAFLDDLLDASGLADRVGKVEAKRRLFLVPGNHDVDRSKTRFLQRTLASQEECDDFFAPGDSSNRDVFYARFHAFQAFFNGYFSGIRQVSAEKHFVAEVIPVGAGGFGPRVGVIGLNSAWFSQDENDRNQLWVGERACDLGIQQVRDQRPQLLIVLTHHSVHWLNQTDEACACRFLGGNCAVHLFGHDHSATTGLIHDQNGQRLALGAGALCEGATKPKRDLWVRVDLAGQKATVRPIRHEPGQRVWTIDPSLYPSNEAEGYCKTFPLPSREAVLPPGEPVAGDPTAYMRAMRDLCSHIEIRGLSVGSGQSHRIPIDDIYIPLTTSTPRREERDRGKPSLAAQEEMPRSVLLEHVLSERCALIVGDPGAGKSTFLRLIAYGLCNTRLGLSAKTTAASLGLSSTAFPLFISIADLAEHMESCRARKEPGCPTVSTDPRWLQHFLVARNGPAYGLDEGFFSDLTLSANAVFLLDGFDEVSTRSGRAAIEKMVRQAAASYEKCRFVVTTRPPAVADEAILPGFFHARIDPLEEEAIEGFLQRWCQALFAGSPTRPRDHLRLLLHALRHPEVRKMAQNPVMLTALAVIYWHEKRLPEQRADLYESVLIWLARSREHKPGRPTPEVCLGYHQELALAMQDHPRGRQVQVPFRWAAERIAPQFPPQTSRTSQVEAVAEDFLRQEELDSGIVVKRGDDIRFWHLTFQEFLCARAIAARPDEKQWAMLVDTPKLYKPEWREVVLLLAGVLHKHGKNWRVDPFIQRILAGLSAGASLETKARCVGLLGAVLSDLSPVGYKTSDPVYASVLKEVKGIFDLEQSKGVRIQDAIAAAEALGQAGDPRFVGTAREKNWVGIPAGEFLMGAQAEDPTDAGYDGEAFPDESLARRVTLSKGYRIGRYPVTVGEYKEFVDAGGYDNKTHWAAGGFGSQQRPEGWDDQVVHPTRPVTGVSWYEAAAYASWAGCRLPTEAQWERAARGKDGRKYPWGDQDAAPDLLNYIESRIDHPTPVGVYPRGNTPEGASDMAGNVWEWCSDWYSSYDKEARTDPTGSSSGSTRVLRGGGWFYDPRYCRSASRHGGTPDYRSGIIGFRVALDLT